jgi:hypothetical protein
MPLTLEPEEEFIYKCLTRDFTGVTDEDFLSLIRRNLQWNFISRIAIENKTHHFLYRVIRRFEEPDYIPKWIYRLGRRDALIMAQRNQLFIDQARPPMAQFGRAGIPYILLRGPFFLERLYQNNPSLRTFSDIDLLILRKDLKAVKEILKSSGFEPVDGAFRDRYYENHHLHLAYARKDINLTFEIHWALDHDYTLYRIDVESIFENASKEKVMGTDMLTMRPDDLLISTVVHTFKHYPLVKYFHSHPVLKRSVYRDGHLIRFLDIFFLLHIMRRELDPEGVHRKAREWEVAQPLAATFHALGTLFGPEAVAPYLWKDDLPKIGRLENYVKNMVFSPDADRKEASKTRKLFFKNILKYREDLYFNPLRVMDLIQYFAPGRAYCIRRYGTRNPLLLFLRRCQRLLACGFRVAWNIFDLGLYSFIRFVSRENKPAAPRH